MTSNQIEYWKLLETQRANAAQERNKEREIEELERSNLAKEQENRRSNLAREAENRRANTQNYRVNLQNARARENANAVGIIGNQIKREELAQKERLSNLEMAYTNIYRDAQLEQNQLDRESRERQSQISADASRYSAQLSSAANRYGAELSSAASRYATTVNQQVQTAAQEIAKYNAGVEAEYKLSALHDNYVLGAERNRIQEEYNKGQLLNQNIQTGGKLIGQLGAGLIKSYAMGGFAG